MPLAVLLCLALLAGAVLDELVRWWWRRGKVPAVPLDQFTSDELARMEDMARVLVAAAQTIEQMNKLLRANVTRVKWLRRTEAQPAIPGETERRRAT